MTQTRCASESSFNIICADEDKALAGYEVIFLENFPDIELDSMNSEQIEPDQMDEGDEI